MNFFIHGSIFIILLGSMTMNYYSSLNSEFLPPINFKSFIYWFISSSNSLITFISLTSHYYIVFGSSWLVIRSFKS